MPKRRNRTSHTLFCSECKMMLPYRMFAKYTDKANGRTKYFSCCRKCATIRSQRYRKTHPEWYINEKRKAVCNKFGLSIEEYNKMYVLQNSRCKICGIPEAELNKKFAIDHCHETGLIRGLLCESCNIMLGNAKDNPTILRLGAEYLEQIALSKMNLEPKSKDNNKSKGSK